MTTFSSFSLNEKDPGQNLQKASVSGKVIDRQTGESLAGVLVVLKNSNIRVYSDLDGNFTFENIEPGTYTVEASLISYSADELKDVVCDAGKETRLTIEIDPK